MALGELNSQRSQDRQLAREITALLGTDDLISMALESWKDLVDEFEYDQVAQAPKNYDLVPGLVEVLFCLLPALRAARRGHCSRLARDKAHPSKSNVSIFNSPSTTVSRSYDTQQDTHADERKGVERILEIAAELLAKRDKLATKRSKNAAKYAPGFETERGDLRDYILRRRGGKSMDLENMKRFEIREKQLREVLCRWYDTRFQSKLLTISADYRRQISRDPNVRDKLANLRPGKSKDKHLQIQDDIGHATEVIDFLNPANSS